MSTEIIDFLTTKFTTTFQEVEKGQTEFPLSRIFQEINSVLKMKVSSSIPTHTRDTLIACLYTLNDAITECRLLSETRRKRALARYTPKEWYQLHRIKGRLLKTMKDLQSVSDAGLSTSAAAVGGTVADQQIPGLLERSKVYGFDESMGKIVASLRKKSDSGINTIGIVGMGGSGKTTLCQLVYTHEIVKREFIPRIWVKLRNKYESGTDVARSITEYILEELGAGEEEEEDDDENNESGQEENEDRTNSASLDNLLVTLHKHLSGKKYLIVFDDVWDLNSWYEKLLNTQMSTKEETGEPLGLPKGYGGGIIITSRLEEDVKEMVGEANLHWPPTLDQNDCRRIFEDVMEEPGTIAAPEMLISRDHYLLIDMKEEMIENCNGLPSAAKTLGHVLSGAIQEELERYKMKRF